MKHIHQVLLGGIFLGLASISHADAYLGGAFGSTEVDTSGYEDSNTFKIYGGFREGNVGLEGAYINFDRFDLIGTGGNLFVDGDGFEVSGVGYLPLGNTLELFGKLGLLAWDFNANTSSSTLATDSGSSFAYGLGLQMRPADTLSLRLEYQGFNDVSGGDLSSIMLGAAIHF